MPLMKFTTRWDGWTGAPGYSNWYADGNLDQTQTDAAAAAIRTFLQAIRTWIPTVVTINMIPTVQVYAEGDGSLADQRNIATVPLPVTGIGAGAFPASTGACVTWRTTYSTGRRLLMGKTFLVPLATTAYQTDGSLDNTVLGNLVAAANTYVNRVSSGTPGHPVAWRRPRGGTGGVSAMITSASMSDKAAVLRSRRD